MWNKIVAQLIVIVVSNINIFEELDTKIQLEIRNEKMWKLHNSTKTGQTLLDSYKNLQNEYEFIIAGDGNERKNLEKQAQNLKINVRFLGRVEGIEALYKKAKILCLCSFVEGLPTVLVESLFFEVVRVSTDYVNSAKDLIQDDLDGFIVPKDDDKAMSEKLALLMSDESLRLRLAQRASKRCADFDTTHIVKKWLTLIDEVLEKKGANSNSNLKPNSKTQKQAQNLGKKAEFQPNSSQNSKPKIKPNLKTKKAKQ